MKYTKLLKLIGFKDHAEFCHASNCDLNYQIESDFNFISKYLGLKDKNEVDKISNLAFSYRTGIAKGIALLYNSYKNSQFLFLLEVSINYIYENTENIDDDDYDRINSTYNYNLGIFTSYNDAAELGNKMIDELLLDHPSTPGINGDRFDEHRVMGFPNYIISHSLFNSQDQKVGSITFRIKRFINGQSSDVFEIVDKLRSMKLSDNGYILGKQFPIDKTYDIVNDNASWLEARDSLKEGIVITHKNHKELELTVTKDGVFKSNQSLISSKTMWFSLHSYGEWKDGYIIKKLK